MSKGSRGFWRTAVAALTAAACLALAAAPAAGAANLEEQIRQQRQRLQDVERQIRDRQRALAETKQQERATLAKLGALQQQVAATQQRLADVEAELRAAEARLAQVTEELESAEARLARRNDLLDRRVRALYEAGSVSYMDVLLSATDFGDLFTRFNQLRRIFQADLRLLRETAALRDEVAKRKAEQEEQRARIVAARQDLLAARQRLEVQTAATRRALEDLQQDREEYERALDELERESREFERLLQRLEAEYAAQLRREGALQLQFPLRIPPVLTSSFGNRYHPILKQERPHTGNDYGAPQGTPVYAAESGVVLYAGWQSGYGNTVIVGHGKGISTLYAHLSAILVASDQRVERGQAIGRVGMTGLATGPHLHFEVRVNGTPVNPDGYLGKVIR